MRRAGRRCSGFLLFPTRSRDCSGWLILRWLLLGTSPLVLIDAAAGVTGAVWLSTYVASLLFQVTATDSATYVFATL